MTASRLRRWAAGRRYFVATAAGHTSPRRDIKYYVRPSPADGTCPAVKIAVRHAQLAARPAGYISGPVAWKGDVASHFADMGESGVTSAMRGGADMRQDG